MKNSSVILAILIVLLFVGTGCPLDPGDVPSMTGTVTITGTAAYGEELTAVPNLTYGGTVTYQWQRDSSDIPGATSSTYTLVVADIGSKITVVATADGISGTGSITSNETATVAKATGPDAPSEAIVGVFPTEATSIELSGFSASATGLEAAVAIDGTTYDDYADVSVDSDGEATITGLTGVTTSTKVRIRVKETSATLAGTYKEISVTAKIPEMTGTVTITGTAAYGEELTAVPGLTHGGTVTYQWQRDSVDIAGATSSTYTLVLEDIGSKITVVATADNTTGTGSITSDETAIVAKATGPDAPSETIVGVFPSEATSIELSGFSASAPGLEAAVAIDGTTYGDYADVSVDGDGEAEITGLTSVTTATKVRIRVTETSTTLAGTYKEISVTEKTALYAVGDLGPAGGYIFYDDEIGYDLNGDSTIDSTEKDLLDGTNDGTVNGDRYLEAAPSDISLNTVETFIFGYYRLTSRGSSALVGTSTSIGTGETNTAALVSKMGSSAYISDVVRIATTTGDYAARWCLYHVVGEYSDWFLPSQDELYLMYTNLYMNSLGGFSVSNYWSSSEYAASYAWQQYFDNGNQLHNYNYKDAEYRVRPVRAF